MNQLLTWCAAGLLKCSIAGLVDSWMTGLSGCRAAQLLDSRTAGFLGFRTAVFSDSWIAGLLGLWGDGLILCIKAHCFNASDGINGFNSCERRGIGRI